ncbi:MAG: UvrD-helicase domain-containing protein [Holosporales bacterium]|nr:UvrD-helicase domain-containing protein [Holosporales bacterium]
MDTESKKVAADLPVSASCWVSASAGSGKTKVLVDRVLLLLIHGEPPASILCLTFTNAAVAEMQERITAQLKALEASFLDEPEVPETQNNGPLSNPSKSEFWEGDTEHRSGAYLDVREHSSTGSTYPKTDFEEFRKRSIDSLPLQSTNPFKKSAGIRRNDNLTAQTYSTFASKSATKSADIATAAPPPQVRQTSFSITNFQLLIDDPYAFYAKQILKLRPTLQSGDFLYYGIWVHHVLDQFCKSVFVKEPGTQNLQANSPPGLSLFAQRFVKNSCSKRFFLRFSACSKALNEEFVNLFKKGVFMETERFVQMKIDLLQNSYDVSPPHDSFGDLVYGFVGIIDRLDFAPDGTISVVDYKTGTVPSKSEIQLCDRVQLPLEALMLSQEMANNGNAPPCEFDEYESPNIDIRAIQLKNNSFYKSNDVVASFSQEMKQTLERKIFDVLAQYLQTPFITSTTHKNRHYEYRHLERIL